MQSIPQSKSKDDDVENKNKTETEAKEKVETPPTETLAEAEKYNNSLSNFVLDKVQLVTSRYKIVNKPWIMFDESKDIIQAVSNLEFVKYVRSKQDRESAIKEGFAVGTYKPNEKKTGMKIGFILYKKISPETIKALSEKLKGAQIDNLPS